ncbi:MAG: magnesium transporter, partial [Pseudomonadota bacterium]|nr:magnesium transporter [Pseudomonadota bacterium]
MSNLDKLKSRLESGKMLSSRNLLNSLHPSELARLIESLPLNERAIIWEMIDLKNEGDVLVEVADEVRDGLIDGMDADELISAIEGMALDDLADLVADLPETLTKEVIRSLDHQDRKRLEQVMAYDEDSAGGLMNVDIITIRP